MMRVQVCGGVWECSTRRKPSLSVIGLLPPPNGTWMAPGSPPHGLPATPDRPAAGTGPAALHRHLPAPQAALWGGLPGGYQVVVACRGVRWSVCDGVLASGPLLLLAHPRTPTDLMVGA